MAAIRKDAGISFGLKNAIDIVRNRAQVYNKIHHISDRPKARNTGRVKFNVLMIRVNDATK